MIINYLFFFDNNYFVNNIKYDKIHFDFNQWNLFYFIDIDLILGKKLIICNALCFYDNWIYDIIEFWNFIELKN